MRKGISPVISAVLVLAVGLTVVGIYSGWAPKFAEDTTQEFVDDSEQDLKCSNAALAIRDASYDKTAQEAQFDLENTGTIRFTEEIFATAINDSKPVGRTTVNGIEVDETRTIVIDTTKIPDEITASSSDCPDIVEEETYVNVTE